MRLLVTRPEPEAARFGKELEALGIEAVLQPLLMYRKLDFDPAEIVRADALIFTSVNGLRAVSKTALSSIRPSTPIFCVGAQTARYARRLGFANVDAVAHTAQQIVPAIKTFAADGQGLVHVSGEHQAFDLEGELRLNAVSIKTVTTYTMLAAVEFGPEVTAALRTGRIDGVTLMSARTASVFDDLCRDNGMSAAVSGIDYYCLSPAIAKRLSFLSADRALIAPFPTREDFLNMIANAAKKQRAVIA